MHNFIRIAVLALFLSQITANAGAQAKPELGRWDEVSPRVLQDSNMSPEELEALEALGYLPFSDSKASNKLLTVHVPEKVASGHTLIISGHDFEAFLEV